MKNIFKISILSLLSIIMVGCNFKNKAWDECTKSSNWTGNNANTRIMNILSPNFSDSQFNDRYNWAKNRGVNYFNLILTDKADGEGAPYSIYGSNFSYGNLDKNSTDVMTKRIKKIHSDGYGIVLWLCTDDSSQWNRTIAANPQQYINDIDKLGWFKYASIVVLGLEMSEYWNASQVNAIYKALRTKYNGKVGTHDVSGKYPFYAYGDIIFYQVKPGTSADSIISQCRSAKSKTGKPICAFEIERQEDRSKCDAILKSGTAYSVGNW